MMKRLCSKCSRPTAKFHCPECGEKTEPINLRKREMARRFLRHARWYLLLKQCNGSPEKFLGAAIGLLYNLELSV